MTDFQIGYLLSLMALSVPAWNRQRYAMGWLWLNLVATLSICLAMDLGAIDRTGATVSMLITDLCAGVGLALRPGIPHMIALGYAVTVPIYFANLVWGVQIDTTFGYIYIAAIAQMGVFAIGISSDLGSGGGGRRRRFASRSFVVSSGRNGALGGALVSCDGASDQVPK